VPRGCGANKLLVAFLVFIRFEAFRLRRPLVIASRVARFFLAKHTNIGKNIPNFNKYIPNGRKRYQMDVTTTFANWPYNIPTLPFQGPPKFIQILIDLWHENVFTIWQT
jgi:hypothetical protein